MKRRAQAENAVGHIEDSPGRVGRPVGFDAEEVLQMDQERYMEICDGLGGG